MRAVDRGGQAAGVRFYEFRFERGEGIGQGWEQVARGAALYGGPYAPVVGEQVHAVAGAGGECGKEEGGVHRGVEAGDVADAAGGGAAGFEDQQDAAVAFGAPGADGEGLPAGGGAPVDGAGVVAGGVVAEAVEFGAFAAGQDAGAAVEFAEPGELGGEVLATGEGGQDAQGPGDVVTALPGREAEWTVGADGDAYGVVVAASGGVQRGREASAFGAGDAHGVAGHGEVRAGAEGAGGPGVPDPGAEDAAARIGDSEVRVGFAC